MINDLPRKTLNVDRSNLLPLYTLKEHDDVILKLALFKNSVSFDITGQTIRLGAKTSAGLKEQNEGFTIDKSNLDIVLKNSILSRGLVELDLQFIDANGQMTTASFFISVGAKVLNDNAVEASNEFDTFKKTVEEIQGDYQGLRTIMIDENNAANLQDQVNQVTASLEENTLQNLSKKNPKCLVTFMDDDCRTQVLTRLKPLSDRYNIPFSLACTTDWVGTSGFMTWEQIKTLYNTGKFEITNHTKSHPSLGTLASEEELINEIVVPYNILKEKGFDIETLTYPFGSTSELARDVIRRNHLNAVATFKGLNEMPINTYYMYRIGVGSYFDPQVEGEPPTDTFEYLKAKVDEAVSKKAWIIFKLHCGANEHTEEQQVILEKLVQYVKTLNLEVVTMKEGMKTFKNIIDAGDIDGSFPKHNVRISPLGDFDSYDVPIYLDQTDSINFSTSLTSFKKNKITVTTIATANATGFPENRGGTLLTYYIKDTSFPYQEYIYANKLGKYIRFWDKNGNSWSKFIQINSNVIQLLPNTVTGDTLPSSFENQKMSVCILSNSTQGMPTTNGGVLETYKNGTTYIFQKYYVYNLDEVYYRRSIDGTTWTTWLKLGISTSPINYGNSTSPKILGAKALFEVEQNHSGALVGDFPILAMRSPLPNGIITSIDIPSDGKVRVKFYNTTDSSVEFNQWYRIKVLKV